MTPFTIVACAEVVVVIATITFAAIVVGILQ